MLLMLAGSVAIGSTLVIVFQPNRSPANEDEIAGVTRAFQPVAHVEEVEDEKDSDSDSNSERSGSNEGEAVAEVPPGSIPFGVRVDTVPVRYLKCWDRNGEKHKGGECDFLGVLERRFETRLYVVTDCKNRFAQSADEGTLELGARVDFGAMSISFWSGPSSTFENSRKIGTCVRRELAGLPLFDIDHKFEEYTLFFTVDFLDPEKRKAELDRKRKRGRLMKVIMNRVRLRFEPVDGRILATLKSNTPLTLLKRKGDWCHVLTDNNAEGWIICDALEPQ